MNFFKLEQNELNNLTVDEIVLPLHYNLHAGEKRKAEAKRNYLNIIKDADDIITFQTLFGSWIGSSVSNKLYFYYNEHSYDIYIIEEYTELEESVFCRFSNVESGCGCDNCIQMGLDQYSTKHRIDPLILEDLQKEMRNIISFVS